MREPALPDLPDTMPPCHDHVLSWPGPPAVRLTLMPERAAYWAAEHTLFVADLHLGKAAVFRARGLPVPQGTTTSTLERLSQALERTRAHRLVVLGDLLHARESHAAPTMAALTAWRQRHADLECVVLQGNHDRHAGDVAASLNFTSMRGAFDTPELLGVHEPADVTVHQSPGTAQRLALAGHVHPVLRLRGRIDQLRLPCFWLLDGVLTLPAFGAFTGGCEIPLPKAGSSQGQAFLIADRSVSPFAKAPAA